jgi:hypothetical protein
MRATLLPHPWMNAFVAFSDPSLVSMPVTLILRPASPPLSFWYCAHALTPLIDPWNRPAEPGTSMAAGTVMLMKLASTPTSEAAGFVPPPPDWAVAMAPPVATATHVTIGAISHRNRLTRTPLVARVAGTPAVELSCAAI